MAPENDQVSNTTPNSPITQNIETAAPILDDTPKTGATTFYKTQAENLKAELEKARQEREVISKRLNEVEESKLREQNQWQELAERYKNEKEKVSGEFEGFKGYFIKEKKNTAIAQEALKAGIREEALNDLSLLDSDGIVEIETTSSGKVNVLGSKEFIENLKTIRPHWFKSTNPPRINTATPEFSGVAKEISVTDILKLQKTNPAEYTRIMKERISSRNQK